MMYAPVATAWMLAFMLQAPVPTEPIQFGAFSARFSPDGSFEMSGAGWPAFRGTWKADAGEIEIVTPNAPNGCEKPARYRARTENARTTLTVVTDGCQTRKMILDRSTWRPIGVKEPIPPRNIVRTAAPKPAALPKPASERGSWPSFRGTHARGVGDGSKLPDTWDGVKGTNVRWKTPIPGLAHSSPIVWGNRLYVTSAISSKAGASFRPGLYGDGDASDDTSAQQWMLYAIDKRTGKIAWQRVAQKGTPREKRHIKSTYASATPATDGRIVVASFGSHGLHAYDVNGKSLWRVDLGRMDLGAYDVPTFEWGTASSPIIWNNLVILQVDTQSDSFLIALKAETGETVWKTDREELPSWGTPAVAMTDAGPVLVTNASNFIRGYDPRTGKELWKIGGSSKITAPTPLYEDGLFVVSSGRAPERPIFAIRPDGSVAWSKTGRGPYMPTPIAYQGLLYVLANNGLLDAYDLKTGAEIYRQRLEKVGNGFSASPVAADGKIYLSNEDGDIIVVAAGREFRQIAVNPMGDLVMATPALSDGAMFVRTARFLFAIGPPKNR